ncbi:MAG TPA: hypothetical protein VHB02_04440 [Acidimicrobiales bacterium]|nr:hypothetical protein [Acidimicrobiales bacterium]
MGPVRRRNRGRELMSSAREPCIVGIALSEYPKAPDMSPFDHSMLAARRALDDCGLSPQAVDGYCADDPITMAEYLDIDYRWVSTVDTGGSMFEYHCARAASAIRSGDCDTVLITYGSDELSAKGRAIGTNMGAELFSPLLSYQAPFGPTLPSLYALFAQRHMYEFGTTSEQLAEIAVAMRYHAGMNPKAMYRDPITVDDVLASRMIADPLHLLDCCVISDGGGAVVMTTRERAVDLKAPVVRVLGTGTAQTHWLNPTQAPSMATSAVAKAAPAAFGSAGVTPADVNTLQTYDSYTITALMAIEDLGFCPKGDGGPFVEGGTLKLGGRLPTNTDGGALSACHPGKRGIFLLIEATRQLRGEAGIAQVPDCRLAVACGVGGLLSNAGVVVLGRE